MQHDTTQKIRRLWQSLITISIALVCITAGLSTHELMARGAVRRVVLADQVLPQLPHAHALRPADSDQTLKLSIGLRPQNEVEMDRLLETMYDPQAAEYQHYLTPQEFTQRFGATNEQVQEVTAYLESEGMSVTDVAPNRLLIDATATVGEAERAFQLRINVYQSNGLTFMANAGPPSVPEPVSRLITAINGLDTEMRYAPLHQRLTPHGEGGLTPNDIASAYDMTPLFESKIQGQGQTIALFEMDGYKQSDLAQYFERYGISPPDISTTLVGRASGAAGQGAIEVEMDIELVAGIAPGADMLVYEGPNTVQGINDTYAKIVNDNRAQVVSISWGICEQSTGIPELRTLDTIFKQGALQGMTLIAASGDSGAYDCQDKRLGVDSPASDPFVTGVGATSLQLSDSGYGGESVWSDPSQVQRGPNGAGSGGGLSMLFKQPGWQKGPGVRNSYSNGFRQVPDITAAGTTEGGPRGYSVYCTVRNAGCPPTGWTMLEGTSAAAPVWAASLLLVNQYRQSNGKKTVGMVNSLLYKLFSGKQKFAAFHDITSGSNLYYPATSSYDLASGIGSPDVYNLARASVG